MIIETPCVYETNVQTVVYSRFYSYYRNRVNWLVLSDKNDKTREFVFLLNASRGNRLQYNETDHRKGTDTNGEI